MAFDEALMHGVLSGATPALRIYGWNSPSFTFGISQNINEELDVNSCRKNGIDFVRRITGGGILFHFDEITYSLVCRKEDIGEDKGVMVSYRNICSFLMRFYESLGLKPSFAFSDMHFPKNSIHSEICCASHEKYDILINGKKIGGNAQKRSKSVILQHGAIPINIDWDYQKKYVRHFSDSVISGTTTLQKELKKIPEKNEIEKKLIESFAKTFEADLTEGSLSEKEEVLVDRLTSLKYESVLWNEKREIESETCLA